MILIIVMMMAVVVGEGGVREYFKANNNLL